MKTWREIPGYEGLYIVSNYGDIVGLKRGIQKPFVDKDGYHRSSLCKNGELKSFYVHRIVAAAFIPNPENKPTVNHIDEDKSNNFVGNLEWATVAEQNAWGTRIDRMKDTRSELEYHAGGCEKKRVLQLDSCGRVVKEWPSILSAAKGIGAQKHGISLCCKGKQKTSAGFMWRFA